MRRHAEQLLARSYEEDLSEADRTWLAAHLASCDACRELQRELTVAEEKLELPEPARDVPARPELRPSGGQRRGAFALAGSTAVIVLAALAIGTLREQSPAATGAPATDTPTMNTPRVVFARHVVLDTVPGGGPVMTEAFDAFVVVTPGGVSRTHNIGGVGVGAPVFDGRGRIAYARRASITRPSGQTTGPSELVVWDAQTDRERVLFSPGDEVLNGGPLWSADRKSLVVSTRTAGTGSAPQSRLLLIDAESGATRTLNVSGGGDGAGPLGSTIAPLYVDAQVIVAIRGSSYLVLDATSGAVRTQAPLRVPGSFMGEYSAIAASSDGTAFELLRRFESDSGPLWIWNVRDPGTDIAKVNQRGISDPIFWPGRTEVVFSAARGTGSTPGLTALDYRTGITRQLASPPGPIRVLAVDTSGRFALVQTDSGIQLLERTGDDLNVRPDLSFAAESILRPLGVFLP
jgi:hypothetical protein